MGPYLDVAAVVVGEGDLDNRGRGVPRRLEGLVESDMVCARAGEPVTRMKRAIVDKANNRLPRCLLGDRTVTVLPPEPLWSMAVKKLPPSHTGPSIEILLTETAHKV